MSNLFWLADERMARFGTNFLNSHGTPRVDDRRVLSGLSFSIAMGCGGRML